jgi:drug/metabolite transporter (DMT)-like permease
MFATAAGFAVLRETLSPLQLLGATVTLSGVLLMNFRSAGSTSD